jgi:hypothetical protein
LSYCLMSWERNEISLPLNQQTLRYGRNLNDVICPLLKLNPIIMSLIKQVTFFTTQMPYGCILPMIGTENPLLYCKFK